MKKKKREKKRVGVKTMNKKKYCLRKMYAIDNLTPGKHFFSIFLSISAGFLIVFYTKRPSLLLLKRLHNKHKKNLN